MTENVESKFCGVCGAPIIRRKGINDRKFAKLKYCSLACAYRRVHSPEERERKRQAKLGPKNPNWKVTGYTKASVHEWVHRHKPSNGCCEHCGQAKDLDAANISQEYKRNITDWEWLCRRCHMLSDGRLAELIERNRLKPDATKKRTTTELSKLTFTPKK